MDAREEAECLAEADGDDDALALLWLQPGEEDEFREAAKHHALKAYKSAWADGEPYVRRYHLEQTKAILDQLGEPYPALPAYDPEKDVKFDWKDEVGAAIEKLKKEKEAKAAETESSDES